MKHILKVALCLMLVLCTLIGFSACKKKNAAATTAPAGTLESATGSISCFYLSGAKYGEEKVWPLADLEISDPSRSFIIFYPEGYGMLLLDDWQEFYFEYADGKLWEEWNPDAPLTYTINGDALTLEQDGYKLIFTRGEVPADMIPSEEDEIIDDTEVTDEYYEEDYEEPTEATAAGTATEAPTTEATEAPVTEATASTEAPATEATTAPATEATATTEAPAATEATRAPATTETTAAEAPATPATEATTAP